LLFIFLIPASPSVENISTSMSMSSSGYGLHSANFKLDITFISLAIFVTTACYIFLFSFFRNCFIIFHIFPKTIVISSGIRASPDHVLQNALTIN
jgi:hypothetical protein